VQRTDTIAAPYLRTLLAAAIEGAAGVYEAYSDHEQRLRSFADLASLVDYVGSRRKEGVRHVAFAVHFQDVQGYVRTRTIQLKPEKAQGATWRETVEGWGLVHVQLAFLDDGLVECRLAANSAPRASAWASTNPELRDPALWDWKLVDRHARRLIRVLQKGASPAKR
jgi:hypothetical protein